MRASCRDYVLRLAFRAATGLVFLHSPVRLCSQDFAFPTPRPLTFGTVEKVPPGPWGDLEYFPMILEPTDFYINLNSDLKNWVKGTVWQFQGSGAQEVAKILIDSGLDPDLAERLVGPEFLSTNETTGLFEIRPPEEVILGLSQDQRRLLYPRLLPHTQTSSFHNPFPLPPNGMRVFSEGEPGVQPQLLSLIERLSYRDRADVAITKPNYFADIALVLTRARDEEERRRVVKVLSREVTFSVRLRISSHSNLQSLTDYWTSGGRNKDVLPILESVGNTKGVETLDLVHLIPPTPRKHLHTYPSPDMEGIGADLPDCFWTAFSFFGDSPSGRYLDFVSHIHRERYVTVSPPYQLGDVILIVDDTNERILHACNYLAGDLVYTKNGKSIGRPWIVSTLPTVLENYRRATSIRVIFSRLRPEFQR